MPKQDKPLIEVKNIGRTYQMNGTSTVALKSATFSINKGEFLAIMGPSGSGKSTLLHLLGLLDRPTQGKFLFDNKDTSEFDDDQLAYLRNAEMGFVFQSFNLLKRTNVFENIKLPLYYSDIPEKEWDGLVNEAIEKVGLDHRIEHESSQLSGGEQQRVAIARAIVNHPKVVFADEPTGNLDSKSGGQIMSIIEKLHEKGHTIILITHEKYTSEFAQRIIRLKDGKLVSDKKQKRRHYHDGESLHK